VCYALLDLAGRAKDFVNLTDVRNKERKLIQRLECGNKGLCLVGPGLIPCVSCCARKLSLGQAAYLKENLGGAQRRDGCNLGFGAVTGHIGTEPPELEAEELS